MRAVLLAAGLGTRLRPLTLTTPKCLVPIHGKPLLEYWFEHIFAACIERALVNTHWLPEKVEAYLAASPWFDRVDLVYEPELLGTGGTVLANREWLGQGPYLVAHADNLTDFDLATLVGVHENRPSGCVMTMLAFRTDMPKTCGILGLRADGIVESFHEKVENPPGNLANAAVYVCEPEVTAFMGSLGKSFIDLSTEVIPHYMGRILSYETSGYHRDIGNPEALALAEKEFRPR